MKIRKKYIRQKLPVWKSLRPNRRQLHRKLYREGCTIVSARCRTSSSRKRKRKTLIARNFWLNWANSKSWSKSEWRLWRFTRRVIEMLLDWATRLFRRAIPTAFDTTEKKPTSSSLSSTSTGTQMLLYTRTKWRHDIDVCPASYTHAIHATLQKKTTHTNGSSH